MRKISLLLITLLALAVSCGPSFSEPLRYPGESTTLVIDTDTSGMRHDGPDNGHTSISLLSKNGTVLFQRKFDDNYKCLGYSSARHAFILQTEGEVGVSLKVDGFAYLPEAKPTIVNSKNFTDHYLAALEAIVPSPDLRYIVFVGQPTESEIWHLYVLDTKSDMIKLLGKAPDPPPLAKGSPGEPQNNNPCDFWQWGFELPTLESNICQFISPNVLKVSYGKDSCIHRSKNRLIRKWTL